MRPLFTIFALLLLLLPLQAQEPTPSPEETAPTVSRPQEPVSPEEPPSPEKTAPPETPAATPSPGEPAPTSTAPAATPSPALEIVEENGATVPIEFSSPQLSLEGFLSHMALAGPLRPDHYLLANGYLDLAGIPRVVREEKGVLLSQQLYNILQSVELDPRDLDVAPEQQRVIVYRQPSGDQVELLRQPDGRWLFSAATVDSIPRMYAVLTNKGRIKRWHLQALDFELLGLNGNLWAALLLLPLLAYGLGSLALMCLRFPLKTFLSEKVGMGTEAQKKLLKPFSWLVASLVTWMGLSLLELPAGLLVILTVVVKFVACASVVVAAFRASDAVSLYLAKLTAATTTKYDDMLIPLVRRSVKTVVAVIGVLFLAQNLDIEVWSLFAGFSIFGAMIALAGQDTVKNFFGSVTVLLDQPFATGDWVLVNGIEGTIEEVGFRSTRIRTFKDSVVTLPNSLLITASVENFGRRRYRRYSKNLPIRRDTPPEKIEAFCEGVREIVRRHPYTRKDNFHVWVYDVNDYALEVLLYVFWAVPDWGTEVRERHRFLLDVHRLAHQLELEFAYPSQRIVLSRSDQECEPALSLEKQAEALAAGRTATGKLLDTSLPKETPPPHVIE